MLNVQEVQAKEPLQGRGCAVQTVRPRPSEGASLEKVGEMGTLGAGRP